MNIFTLGGQMGYEIIGVGKSEPTTVLSNKMLETLTNTSDKWIVERTGIKERRIVSDSEEMRFHAKEAALKAIKCAKVKKEEIEFIVFATIRGDYRTPSQAIILAQDLGIKCPGIDINGACSGFLYALDVANGKFLSGINGKILVIGMDFMSKFLDYDDRSTCVLFGDGGGAVVLSKGEGLIDSLYSCEPNFEVLNIKSSNKERIVMNGKEVYKYAVNIVSDEIKRILEKNNLTLDDIDLIIPHQANSRILEGASKRLGIEKSKMVDFIEKRGNTSAGSIPLVLSDLYENHILKKGMKILLIAFGAGLCQGTVLLNWTLDDKNN